MGAWHDHWAGRVLAAEAAGDSSEDLLARAAADLERLSDQELLQEMQRPPASPVEALDRLLRAEWCRRHGIPVGGGRAFAMPPRALDLEEYRAICLTEDGGDQGTEVALETFRRLLDAVSSGEDPVRWSRLQHQLAESYVRRNTGSRAQNLELAIGAYRAALPGRIGEGRVITLLGLAQALRQRRSGEPGDARRDHEAVLDEAEQLARTLGDPEASARVMYERGRGLALDGRLEAGLELVRRAAAEAPRRFGGHAAVAEAQILCEVAEQDPSRRPEAVRAVSELPRRAVGVPKVRLAGIVRGLRRALGDPVPAPDPESLAHGLLPGAADLGDARLTPRLRRALEARLRREEEGAFAEPLASALVEHERALAPLRFRLAREAAEAGQHATAVGHIARLGAWRLRRALRWADSRAWVPAAEVLNNTRILEGDLERLMAADRVLGAELSDVPVDPAAAERIRRWSSGEEDSALLGRGASGSKSPTGYWIAA